MKIIKLARNFGQQRAESAGIRYARGKIIITMDGDLQYNPQDIPRFLKKIEEGYDAVIGYRESRKEGFFTRRLPSRIANIIMSFLSGVHFKDIGCPFIAFRRELKEGIENYGEAGEGNTSFFILWRASKIGIRKDKLPFYLIIYTFAGDYNSLFYKAVSDIYTCLHRGNCNISQYSTPFIFYIQAYTTYRNIICDTFFFILLCRYRACCTWYNK